LPDNSRDWGNFYSSGEIGKEGIIEGTFPNVRPWKGILEIVELGRAKTNAEKWAEPYTGLAKWEDMPLLLKAWKEARKKMKRRV
jgi:hypothetical protein